MLKNKEKEIKGIKYSVTVMDGITALNVQTRLLKIFGSSIDALKNLKMEDLKMENVETFLPLISEIFKNTDAKEIDDLVQLLFSKGVFTKEINKANGEEYLKKVELETHFAGKSMQIWEVVMFILKVNFGFQLD